MFKILLLYFQIFQRTPDEPDVGENQVVPNSKRTIITDRFTPGVNHTILKSTIQSPTSQPPVYSNKAPPPPPPEKNRQIEFYNPSVTGGLYKIIKVMSLVKSCVKSVNE